MKIQKILFVLGFVVLFMVNMLGVRSSVARPFGGFTLTGDLVGSSRPYSSRSRRSARRRGVRRRSSSRRRRARNRARVRASRRVRYSRKVRYMRARRDQIGRARRKRVRQSAIARRAVRRQHVARGVRPRSSRGHGARPAYKTARKIGSGENIRVNGRRLGRMQARLPRLDRDERKAVQLALSRAGFYRGAADGLFGSGTRKAIRAYQGAVDQGRTGRLNRVQLASLMKASSVGNKTVSTYLPERDRAIARRKRVRQQARQLARKDVRSVADARVGSDRARGRDFPIARPSRLSRTEIVEKLKVARIALPFVKPPRKPKKERGKRTGSKPAQTRAGEVLVTASFNRPVTGVRPGHKKRVSGKGRRKGAVKKVDYFHALGRIRNGENLWVVKCIDKKQLRLYYWQDKQWWVRGSDGGAIGHRSLGRKGIRKLAGKVCTS